MTHPTRIFDAAPQGLYIGLTRFEMPGRPSAGQAFDPTADRDEVHSLYADALTEGPVVVILLTAAEEGVISTDVTAEIHAEVNAYLRARRQGELPPLDTVMLSRITDPEFLMSIQSWPDGAFGSISDYASTADLDAVRQAVNDWVDRYGKMPGNAITGVILQLRRDEAGWAAEIIETCPQPARKTDELDEARP